jgi:hypothetical protein
MSFPINVTSGTAVTDRTNTPSEKATISQRQARSIWVMMPDSSSKLNIDIQTRVSSHLNGNPNFWDNDAWWNFRTEQIS